MNIYEEVQKASTIDPGKTAMLLWSENGVTREYTYRQMLDSVQLFSEELHRIGIKKGYRVAIVAESVPEWSIAYLSIINAGCTAMLIDASLSAEEIGALLRQSDASCIYTSTEMKAKIQGFDALPLLDIHSHGAPFPGDEHKTCNQRQEDTDERVASVIFSSGTTKHASGVMHGHDGIIGSTLMCVNNNKVTGKDRFFGVLPNSHIYGLYTQVIAPLILGGSVCYVESMSAACLVGAMKGYSPTVFPAVPKIFDVLKTNILKKINSDAKTQKLFELFFPICLKIRKATGINLGKLLFKSIGDGLGGKMRVIASAGAPTDKETAEFYYGVGLNLLITYGATETSIPVIGNYGGHLTTDTCGKPYPGIQFRTGEANEIQIRSPFLMLGYFRDEEATKAAYTADGWMRTGDWGFVDGKQNIHICGRCKDNIVLSTGKKLAPDEVEKAYAGISGVEDLVICGVPVAAGGCDTVHAFIKAKEENHASIMAHLNARGESLSQNMRLAGVHFVNSIPQTTLQKPKRFMLAQMAAREQEEAVSSPGDVPRDLPTFLRQTIARLAHAQPADLQDSTRILEELAIDSLATIELAMEIENFCGVDVVGHLRHDITLGGLIALVSELSPAQALPADAGAYLRSKNRGDYNIFHACRFLISHLYNVVVRNDTVLPKDSGYIICANHVTNFDYFFLTQKFQREQFMKFCCMAKKELFRRNPFSAMFVRIAGLIPVDRAGNSTQSFKVAKEKLKENWGVLVHPEGTRSKTGQIGDFKPGAALLALENNAPIVPAYIKGGYEVFPPSRMLPKFFNWKARSRYTVEVIYGEPIFPGETTVDELMQRVSSAVQTMASGASAEVAI